MEETLEWVLSISVVNQDFHIGIEQPLHSNLSNASRQNSSLLVSFGVEVEGTPDETTGVVIEAPVATTWGFPGLLLAGLLLPTEPGFAGLLLPTEPGLLIAGLLLPTEPPEEAEPTFGL